MNITNLSEAVTNALERLKVVKEMPASPATDKELPALNGELRKLRKRLWDQMNGLPWGKERKTLQGLFKQLDRALSNWEYQTEVNVSDKRLREVDNELSAGGLNNSKRKKLQKERRMISALRRKGEGHGRAASAPESTPRATKSVAEKIAEYEADLARTLSSGTNEG